MARLIVRDGDRRKAYRIQKGRLTIGSGEEARLRLESEGVAETHAVLEVRDGRARLVPHPGAPCPLIDGEEVAEAVDLDFGQRVELGAAVLEWAPEEGDLAESEPEDSEEPEPDHPPAFEAPKSVVRARKSSLPSYRGKHKEKSSTPTVLIAVLVAVVLGAAFWFFFQRGGSAGLSASERIRLVEAELDQGDLANAERLMADFSPASLSGDTRAAYEALRERYDEAQLRSKQDAANVEGFEYYNKKLADYYDKHLADGDHPERGYFLLLRCREFTQRWPSHPEVSWVGKTKSELGISLDRAPTYPELAWAVDYIVGSKPRRFDWADELVDRFLADCGEACDEGERLQDKVDWERRDYFSGRREEANSHYQNGKADRAVGILIELVRYINDEDMQDRACQSLLKIPELEAFLRYQKDTDEHAFAELLENERMAAYVKEKGL